MHTVYKLLNRSNFTYFRRTFAFFSQNLVFRSTSMKLSRNSTNFFRGRVKCNISGDLQKCVILLEFLRKIYMEKCNALLMSYHACHIRPPQLVINSAQKTEPVRDDFRGVQRVLQRELKPQLRTPIFTKTRPSPSPGQAPMVKAISPHDSVLADFQTCFGRRRIAPKTAH